MIGGGSPLTRISREQGEALEKALDANPKVGVAFGKVDVIGMNGNPERKRMASPGIPLGVRAPWREALDLDRDCNLGIPYRGLIRTKLLSPVPVTPGDNYADQIWIFFAAYWKLLSMRVPPRSIFRIRWVITCHNSLVA